KWPCGAPRRPHRSRRRPLRPRPPPRGRRRRPRARPPSCRLLDLDEIAVGVDAEEAASTPGRLVRVREEADSLRGELAMDGTRIFHLEDERDVRLRRILRRAHRHARAVLCRMTL